MNDRKLCDCNQGRLPCSCMPATAPEQQVGRLDEGALIERATAHTDAAASTFRRANPTALLGHSAKGLVHSAYKKGWRDCEDGQQPSPAPELVNALRQYQHNDCSGVVFGYDKAETERIVEALLAEVATAKARQEHAESVGDNLANALEKAQARLAELEKQKPAGYVCAHALDCMQNGRGGAAQISMVAAPSGYQTKPIYTAPVAQAGQVPDGAGQVLFVMRNLGAMDSDDIDGDNVDLRFEDDEGRDTGCDISIVEYAEKAADLIEAMIAGAAGKARDV